MVLLPFGSGIAVAVRATASRSAAEERIMISSNRDDLEGVANAKIKKIEKKKQNRGKRLTKNVRPADPLFIATTGRCALLATPVMSTSPSRLRI